MVTNEPNSIVGDIQAKLNELSSDGGNLSDLLDLFKNTEYNNSDIFKAINGDDQALDTFEKHLESKEQSGRSIATTTVNKNFLLELVKKLRDIYQQPQVLSNSNTDAISDIQQKLTNLKQILKDKDLIIKELRKQLEEQSKEKDQRIAEFEAEKAKLEEKNRAQQIHVEQNLPCQQKLQNCKEEKAELKQSVTELENHIEMVQQALIDKQKFTDECSERLEKLREELKVLRESEQTKSGNITDLENQIRQVGTEKENLENQVTTLKDEAKHLNKKLEELKTFNNSEVTDLERKITQCQQEKEYQEQKCNADKKKIIEARTNCMNDLDNKREELDQKSQHNSKLRETNQRLKTQNEQIKKDLIEYQDKQEKLRKEVEEQQEKLRQECRARQEELRKQAEKDIRKQQDERNTDVAKWKEPEKIFDQLSSKDLDEVVRTRQTSNISLANLRVANKK